MGLSLVLCMYVIVVGLVCGAPDRGSGAPPVLLPALETLSLLETLDFLDFLLHP